MTKKLRTFIILIVLIFVLILPIIKYKKDIKIISSNYNAIQNNSIKNNDRNKLKTKTNFLKNISNERKRLLSVLKHIEKNIVKTNVNITKYDIDKNLILLEGYSKNNTQAIAFINSFKNNPLFKNAEINNIKHNKNLEFFFKMKIKIKN